MPTLIEEMSELADELREMHDEFGTRSHTVKMVAIKRYGREEEDESKRGTVEVIYEHTLKPTPRVRDAFNNQRLSVEEFAWIEAGYLLVDEISFTYSMDQLLGYDWNSQDSVEFFWELVQKIPKQSNLMRRRYRPKQVPGGQTTKLGWRLLLEAVVPDRDADGSFQDPY